MLLRDVPHGIPKLVCAHGCLLAIPRPMAAKQTGLPYQLDDKDTRQPSRSTSLSSTQVALFALSPRDS